MPPAPSVWVTTNRLFSPMTSPIRGTLCSVGLEWSAMLRVAAPAIDASARTDDALGRDDEPDARRLPLDGDRRFFADPISARSVAATSMVDFLLGIAELSGTQHQPVPRHYVTETLRSGSPGAVELP